jgi:hypothetical protein
VISATRRVRKARRHDGGTLHACPPVQARPARAHRRKIAGSTALEDHFGPLLDLALRVRHQEQRQRGPKVYWLHAPEVECDRQGQRLQAYEFGCKAPLRRRSPHPRAASSCRTPRRCTATPTTATRAAPSCRSRKAHRRCDPPHPRVEELPRPQLPRPIQGLDQRPDPPCHQAVRREPRRSRARDRPSQGRPSDSPQPTQRRVNAVLTRSE